MSKFANVIVDISHEKLDKTFQYIIPKEFENTIETGMQVKIPFGPRFITGYVIEITDEAEYDVAKLKPKALPEDVKKVLGSWESIRETLEPLLANMLTNCRLSINDEDVLLVVPTEKLSEEYLKKEGAMDSLREAVAERVGKEVKMELKPLVDDDDFTDNYVDVVRMFGKLVVKDDTI